jgi:hypothetical protein
MEGGREETYRLEFLQRFAHTDEFDGLPADAADRESSATTGVTVELGQNRT